MIYRIATNQTNPVSFSTVQSDFSSSLNSPSLNSPSLIFARVKSILLAASLPAMLLGVFLVGFSAFSMAAELLNINSADVETIASALDGIGPAKAQAIVDYRQQNGTFLQVQDLTNVPGIGEVTLDQIKSMITVGDSSLAE